jgi:hypothetical protein
LASYTIKMKSFSLVLPLILVPLSAAGQIPPIRNVFTFPNNTFIEDIAVRSNSDLILTSESVPTLFSVDPTVPSPTATALYTFPNTTGLSGITETSPDIFALVTGIWDLANTRATNLAVWTINFNHPTPVIRHVTGIVNSTIFNGIAAVPGSNVLILAADSAIGAVWRVNILTGDYEIVFQDSLFLPVGTAPGTNLGINGIRTKDGFLYFTNSAQGIFGRVPINRFGGKTGPVEVISSIEVPGGHYDSFAFGREGSTWIATHPNDVVEVKADGSQVDIKNETMLLNPTSAQFGRGSVAERRTLYVTNGGEFAGNDLINEGVVAVDVGRF